MPTLAILATLIWTAAAGQVPYQGPSASTEQNPSPSPRQSSQSDVPPDASATGQRQTREILSQDAGIEPMARINGRIQNRVQSRIRNRIDRYYDPQANAASPFEVAGDQARAAGRPRR